MKINRETFLNQLAMVRAGVSPREFIEQSSCFCFSGGMVMTFNDEIACRMDIGFDIEGAVQAAPLLAMLEKMDDPELMVIENDNGEMEFRGKEKRFAVTKDAEIFLPINQVEMPEDWDPLPKAFTESVGLVRHCVSTDESRFNLCCIHIHPDFVEACDNFQMMRYWLKTGIKAPMLVRGTSLAHITALGMDQMALTKSWIHFKNQSGLIFSSRKHDESFLELDPMLKFKGHPVVIPKGLADSADRAAIFATDKSGDALVTIGLNNGVIRLEGAGLSGWYREMKSIAYEGPPLRFVIRPDLLKRIASEYSDAQIGEDKLKVSGDHWDFVTVLGRPEEDEPEETDEPREEKAPKKSPKK